MIEYENLLKLNRPFFDAYTRKFSDVLESGWFILGSHVAEFEKAFANYCGAPYCAGVANGLDALILSLKAFNFPFGKEVIVPSNTYIATILAVLQCGLKPVLVEPDINTYNIDPDRIEEAITPNTVAIIVVHLYGKCCAMEKISRIKERFGLKLIEDCAQAHGATFQGQRVGTFGDFGAFSFYPTKNLGALGDAGCVTTADKSLMDSIKMFRNYGSEKKYYNDVVGMNSRLDEMQAAFLSVKLEHLDSINSHKRKLADIYLSDLKDDFIKPQVHPDYFDVYHIFNIRHPKRNYVREFLLNHDIKTEIHYPVPPHLQKAMKGLVDEREYPISEEIHNTTLSLPISYFHTEDDVCRVVEILNKI